ncbi:hypothetical protein BGZ67_007126 [Mortierella alpina]|nr:hypothetical protein BGZ67_007126 [Mortierella alpina]
MDTGLRDPFDLPEVRALIAAYLTQSDAIACSRVCKAWSIYFRGLVWHTVDFARVDHSKMALLAVVNYGHHVRAVKSLQSSSQINTLMWNQRRLNLTSLSVVLSAELSYRTDLNDFLRLVRRTLTELDMTVESPKTTINVPVDVILPREPSRLTKISLLAILKHSKTLKYIECLPPTGTLLYNFPNPPRVTTAELSNVVWIILSIPRLCPHLESFYFPLHEIDMDDIESDEWECKGLKELRIRIVGLNTAQQIDQAIGFWLEGRRALRRGDAEKQDRSPMLTDTDPFDLWILGSRVADHLLKFKDLHTVWLGTTVWRV